MKMFLQPGTVAVLAGILLLGLIAWILWAVGSARRQLRDLRARLASLQSALERPRSRFPNEMPSPSAPTPETRVARAQLIEELPVASEKRTSQVPSSAAATEGATEIDQNRFGETISVSERPQTLVPETKEEDDDVDLPINEAKLAEIPFHEVLAGTKKPTGKKGR